MKLFVALGIGTFLQFYQAAIYTNDWALRINGGVKSATRVAEKYGFTYMGQIGALRNHHIFRHHGMAARSTAPNNAVTVHVAMDTEVEWLQQQAIGKRVRRTFYSCEKNSQSGDPLHRLNQTCLQHLNEYKRRYNLCSDDSEGCRPPMNIAGAWGRGYTGRGVVVSVLDDGLDGEHPDLKPNYDALASFDVNGQERHPSASYSVTAANSHGTRCAGMVAAAMSANQSTCTAGVAFRTRIGGVRMLDVPDGEVTDVAEAQALSFKPQYVDIYLASWGPVDDGATVDGPGPLTRLALKNGIQTGRHGRGSVYVWAAGSGGHRGDHCSCDGYSNSIYTISISSGGGRVLQNQPENQERCASTLAAASAADEISCGPAKWDPALSASAAAGIIALSLEANPLLTWRDLQHIIVQTSDTRQLAASDWQMNGAGHKVSHLYGFGLLDAEGMVLRAKRWRRVPPQSACTVEAPTPLKRILAAGRPLTSVLETSGCSASSRRRRHVAFVEHVVVRVTVACCRRGDLSIALTSPSGTVSQLLDKRPHDNSTEGFHRWEFMTTHCWGERADGEWTLNICDSPSQGRENSHAGRLDEWSLVIYGTARPPYPAQRRPVRSADVPKDADFAEEYTGPCDPECSDDGCDGPGPRQCVTCARYFLKLKNNTRTCVSGCPRGFWGDRRRCKRCYATCESCTGSRSDQCTSCLAGYHLTEGADTCTAVCEEGFFLDHDANMCRKCGERCSRCTSAGVCTECKADSSPRGSRCLPSCAPGMYHDEAEGVCKACHRACAACAGAGVEACTECADGYLTEQWRCVPSCRSGFFATDPEMAHGRWACRRCDASCLTCVGPGRANCSSCSSGHSLQEGECVLRTACTDGEYQDGDGMCHPCHPTCSKCTGPQHLDCVSCGASHALDEGRCLAECPRGKYQSGGQCHLCDHTCATCVEAGPSNCTNCDSDKFGTERYLHKGGCVDACPEAFYRTPERTCEACPHPCTLCTSAAHCLRCNASHYLSDGACVKLECDEGEVEDPDSSDCMACEEGCRQCVLYNPRHCLSCKDGFYNFQDGCYKNCPAKTYSEDEEMSCVPCDGNCVSCDRHECYWCETDLFLAEGKCVSVCPEGFYGDEDTNDCEECHADCATCRRPGRDGCVSCGDGKTLHDGRCLTEGDVCPVLTFRGGDGECVACHPSCESCSGKDKNQCTKCTKGHFLSPQHTCVSKCPAGSFEDRLSGQCEACPAGCLHCVDLERCTRCLSRPTAPLFLQDGHCVQQCLRGYPAGQACRSCAPGCASCEMNAAYCLSCREPLLLLGHRCVGECPAGHTLHIQECRRCPAACEECSPLGECTACEEYHFLHEGACVPDCPDRFFGDNERRECLRCSADCRSCDGPGRRDCDACEDPRAILLHGECVTPCPAQTFVDDATGECRPCDVSCLTCAGPSADSCSGCREGFGLEGRGGCQPCHKDCRRCSGPGKNRCLSCKHRRLLLDGSCVDECPPSFYGDESRHKCEACHPTCQSCVGKRSRECLACKDGLFRHGNHCVETCPHSHRGNRASGACEPCDPTCGGCSGDGDCLSCAPGLVFMPREGRCLRACPDGFYRRQDGDDATCERCHGNCATCSGKGSHSCESCGPGYRQSGSTCVSVCDTAEYPLIKVQSHLSMKYKKKIRDEGYQFRAYLALLPEVSRDRLRCCRRPCEGKRLRKRMKGLSMSPVRVPVTGEDCDASCLRCEGAGPAECSACPPHAILEAGGRCLLCCHVAAATRAEDCCNCTQTTGQECVLTTNLAFKNEEEEERGNPVVFIMAGVLLGAGIVAAAAVFLIRHSRSKRAPSDGTQRGYEKLGSGSGSGGCSSPSSRDKGMQMDDLAQHYSVGKDDEDGDDDEEDIVYISRDGTVYRKFRYGETGEDLEYDDESDTYR
ncbi:LOW QUALITY PROTEIN: proprotein convertase subtilisin/kexin type 5-like [Syngnathoides biaculeatus]|uniref:LOW QUALITY PROTEIN: proprotein convertase subtilisin/kexin type 5-like n=1 Tax=Syngnathoides biaculeatus TaxID=300417 RepID=UPI002ADE4C53|nr:LOW QUALITY PROTEIN: proprotein convertase subtilisin/kexin type 5-like [Syngnathoides biaculeatus]